MDNLITLKIKATSFDRLIKELKSLKDMYLDFSNNTDNIITGSSFHIIVKDLETLIAKYEYKKAPCTKTRSTKKLKASKFYHERTELKIWKL